MDFSWIKKLFKKNEPRITTSDIATIDTSFIRVPKLSKLSKEEQEIVLEFYNKLVAGSDEDLVKYSNDLLDKANIEREILVRAMSRYDEQYRAVEKKYKRNLQALSAGIYNLGKLASLEYSNIENNITDIRRELVLKLVALNMYIKKEEKRKYDFLGIFGKAERIKYLTDKNKLKCERERLLTSIKIDDNILATIKKDINENQILGLYRTLFDKLNNSTDTNQLRDFLDDSMSRLSKKSLFSVIENFEKELKNDVIYKMKDYPMRDEAYNCSYFMVGDLFGLPRYINDSLIKYVLNKMNDHNNKDYNWKDFLMIVPDEFLGKLYEIVAKYSHERDLYVFEHRNDYKKYLQDMKDLISKCDSTSFEEWDTELLNEKIKYFTQVLNHSLQLYGNERSKDSSELYDDQIGPPTEEQIKKNYFKLLFFYSLKNGFDINLESLFKASYYDFLKQPNMWDIYNEFYNIYDELSVDVLNKFKVMPELGIKRDIDYIDFEDLKNKINEVVDAGKLLYKLLEGTYDERELYAGTMGFSEDKNCGSGVIIDHLNDSIYKFNNSKDYDRSYRIEDEYPITIEDLYHLSNVAFADKKTIYEYISKRTDMTHNLLAKIKWSKIERENDDRIFIIPKQVHINETVAFPNPTQPLVTFKFLNLKKENIAMYVSDIAQTKEVYDLFTSDHWNNMRYLMMNESVLKAFMDRYGNWAKHCRYVNVISVPDGTKYSELSKYLDKRLMLENKNKEASDDNQREKKSKVLSKKNK